MQTQAQFQMEQHQFTAYRKIALILGIKGKIITPTHIFPALSLVESDVNNITAWCEKFNFEITTLLDDQVTQKNLKAFFDKLFETIFKAEKTMPQKTKFVFFCYYSGHGV